MVHWIIGLKKSFELYSVAFSSHTQLLKFMQVDCWAYLGLEFCQYDGCRNIHTDMKEW